MTYEPSVFCSLFRFEVQKRKQAGQPYLCAYLERLTRELSPLKSCSLQQNHVPSASNCSTKTTPIALQQRSRVPSRCRALFNQREAERDRQPWSRTPQWSRGGKDGGRTAEGRGLSPELARTGLRQQRTSRAAVLLRSRKRTSSINLPATQLTVAK